MGREVRLHDIEGQLDELDYPVTPARAADRLDDVTLRLADGEANLGDLLARLPGERYESAEDVVVDLHGTLPRRAVGEPYQSEGDG